MNKFPLAVLVAISVAGLSACQKLKLDDQANRYQQATLISPIIIPADMMTQAFIPLFDLPPRAGVVTESERYEAPLPPISGLTPAPMGQRQAGMGAAQVDAEPSGGFLSGIPIIGGLLARDEKPAKAEKADSGSLLSKLPFFRSTPSELATPPAPAAASAQTFSTYEPPAVDTQAAASSPEFSQSAAATVSSPISTARINKTVVTDELGRPILFVQDGLAPAHARVAQSLQKAGLSTESSDDLSVIRVRSKEGKTHLIYFSGRDQITSVVVLAADMTPAPTSTSLALIDLISTNW